MIPNKLAYFSHGTTYRTNRDEENINENTITFVGDDVSIATKGNIFGVRGVYPGTCTTAAGTAAKVATTTPLFPLDSNGKPLPGTTIAIKFSNTNTYKTAGTTMTLNVNSTGAYPIYYNNAEVVSTTSANTTACGYKNRYTFYIFNGTQWVWLSYGNDANTTYSNVSLGQGYAIQNNESESDTVTATLSSYTLTTGGIVVVKFIFDIPGVSSPTLNVNAKGAKAIYHNGSPLGSGIIKSGDLATFIYSTNYYLISLDRDFNDPVSVGTLNTNNSTTQTVNSSESFSSNISLHKISKTGSYNDLLDKPTIPTIPDHKTLDGVSLVGSTGDVDKIVFGKLNANGSFTRYGKVGNEWAMINVPTNPAARILYVDVFTELSYYYDTVVSQYKLIGPNPDLSGFLTSETPLSMGTTTGNGNAVTDISVSGHQITLTKGTTFLTASDITGKADKSAAIGSLSLSLNTTDYKITLTGTYVDGTPFTVSDVIDLPLESVVVSGSYDPSTKKVVLTLKNNSTVEFSIADLISGLQSEITSNNKLSADLVENGTTNKVYTATEQTKLSGIEAGAEVNVQPDWNQTNTSADDYVKNKPTLDGVTITGALNKIVYGKKDSNGFIKGTRNNNGQGFTWLANNVTPEEHVLYIDITNYKGWYYEGGSYRQLHELNLSPYENVQADWNETDDSSDAYIWNKPTIPSAIEIIDLT